MGKQVVLVMLSLRPHLIYLWLALNSQEYDLEFGSPVVLGCATTPIFHAMLGDQTQGFMALGKHFTTNWVTYLAYISLFLKK